MTAVPYFAIQRLRGGVRPDQVRDAVVLLGRETGQLQEYVRNRLVALHGPAARDPGWLVRQPLVDRADLVEVHQRALASGERRGIEARRTSGSTGVPFRFARSAEMLAWMDAAMWAAYSWHGIGPGDKRLRFWGLAQGQLDRFKRRVADRLTRQLRLSAFDMDPRASAIYFRRARRYRARYAYGYPTLVSRWAAECTAAGLDGRELGLQCVITTGELLAPGTRTQLERFFGCRIINEYGCTESGVIAFECESGTAHVLPVAAWAEVVDQEGRPVEPGTTGEVVVSDLYGQVLPMLRYRLHDLAVSREAHGCRCGRALPAIEVAIGREGSFISLPSGRRVFSTVLAYAVTPAIASFRAHQRDAALLVADVTLQGSAEPGAAARELQEAWGRALDHELEVQINIVTTLPREPSGKLRYFVPLGS